MECPVCLDEGKDLTPAPYKGLVVSCRRCGFFRITKGALLALTNLKVERRFEALEQAGTRPLKKLTRQ